MDSFYQFAALISAATWATSGAFLKAMNFKENILHFHFMRELFRYLLLVSLY